MARKRYEPPEEPTPITEAVVEEVREMAEQPFSHEITLTRLGCGSCAFFLEDDDRPDRGNCRRYPPAYPYVYKHQWCGEYKTAE